MAISQTITDIPTPPSSSDATNFRTRADAFMASLDTLSTELNTFRTQANALETNVNSKESSATSSASIALASSNFKGAWDIGTAYTVPSSVLHGGTYYMALVNSTGQTPPNATYWSPINISSNISYDNTASGLTATNVQTAIDEIVTEKAPLASPAFTDTPTAPTATAGTYTTQVATMEAVNSSIVQATAYTFTGTETFKDFTGIPSWAKRITVMFNGVSTNGTSIIMVQLGDSGGIENTGYLGVTLSVAGGTVVTVQHSSGIPLTDAAGVSDIRHANLVFNLVVGNTWSLNGVSSLSTSVRHSSINSTKTLSSELTTVRITTVNGTDTFDAGTINISWEG